MGGSFSRVTHQHFIEHTDIRKRKQVSEDKARIEELEAELAQVIEEDSEALGAVIEVIENLKAENEKLKAILAEERVSPHILVTEFHETYNMPIRETPVLDIPARKMRLALVTEEAEEYAEAEANDDLIEIADALADIVYVAYGAALEHGIDLDEVLKEVQRSNLSKLHHETGLPIYREDGKVLKGENFFPPNVEEVLIRLGWEKK